MIAILDNLISSLMLPVGFVLDNFIMLLKNPFGFIVVFSSITFFEYSTTKSIVKDTKRIKKIRIKDVSKNAGVATINIRKKLTINSPLCVLCAGAA